MLIQFILSFFLLFAISRVILQVKTSKLSIASFLFWSSLFILALIGVLEPALTSYIAKLLGIGRGTDVILYLSIVTLFYLIFRLSIMIEDQRREITELVRKIAFQSDSSKHTSKKKRK